MADNTTNEQVPKYKQINYNVRNPVQAAYLILIGIGAPTSIGNLKAMTAWELHEGGHWNNTAKFNPLNTTLRAKGSKPMNSVGVQAYTSWRQGIGATIDTLLKTNNGKSYAKVVAAFKNNQSPDQIAYAIRTSPWGTHGIQANEIKNLNLDQHGGKKGLAIDPGTQQNGTGDTGPSFMTDLGNEYKHDAATAANVAFAGPKAVWGAATKAMQLEDLFLKFLTPGTFIHFLEGALGVIFFFLGLGLIIKEAV